MKIEILGPGCPRCVNLEANVKQAVADLDIDATIEKITDMSQIMSYGVMSTPGILIDGKVVGFGKLFSVDEIKDMLTQASKN